MVLSGLNFLKHTRRSEHRDPETRLTRRPAAQLHLCVFCVSTATRRQAGVLSGGEEAHHGGGERSPREAAAAEPAGGL